jgi:hypothetical protein
MRVLGGGLLRSNWYSNSTGVEKEMASGPKRFGPTVLAGSGQLGRFPSASGSLTRAQWPPEVSVHSDP